MNEYINVYADNPTKNEQDGMRISIENSHTSPLSVSLEASNSETKYIKCAIRTEKGYKSTATSLSCVGLTRDKWKLALDNDYDEQNIKTLGEFKDSIVINDIVTDKNTIFWAKVSSSIDEKPKKDITVSILVDSYIETE